MNQQQAMHVGVVVILCIYIWLGIRPPSWVIQFSDTLAGKVALFVGVVGLFLYSHPMIGVLFAWIAFTWVQQGDDVHALKAYEPTEEKKMSQFTAMNQFPYTLEQEVVAKMAPIVRSGYTLQAATYKPLLEPLHDAAKV